MTFPSSTISLNNIEQAAFSAFRVEVDSPEGKSEATGFFVGFRLKNGNNAIVLISCRHVLEGATSVRLWVPIEKANGRILERFADITLALNGGATSHPDPEVDLAGCVIHHIENQFNSKDEKLFYRMISEQQIPSSDQWEDISIGDDVYVIGCPHGLEDQRNRRPLVRKGVIASLPKEIEASSFLIDVPTLAGSSGSPIVVQSHISFNRLSKEYELRSRFYIVGVVSNGLEARETGEESVSADLHLGSVVKSTKIRELFLEILKTYGLSEIAGS